MAYQPGNDNKNEFDWLIDWFCLFFLSLFFCLSIIFFNFYFFLFFPFVVRLCWDPSGDGPGPLTVSPLVSKLLWGRGWKVSFPGWPVTVCCRLQIQSAKGSHFWHQVCYGNPTLWVSEISQGEAEGLLRVLFLARKVKQSDRALAVCVSVRQSKSRGTAPCVCLCHLSVFKVCFLFVFKCFHAWYGLLIHDDQWDLTLMLRLWEFLIAL